MDFLDEIYFDNTIRSYAIVIGTILLAFILKRILSKYIASILYIPVRRAFPKVDKKPFVDLVVQPLEMFLVILVSIIALDKLNFPEGLNFKIYHVTSQEVIESIFIGILIIAFIWLILRVIDFIGMVLEEKANITDKEDAQLIFFFKDFFKVIVVIIGIVLILKFCFNAHIGQLVTGLSIVGAALALAAKESLENLIASFIIFFDKPFVTGDQVRINNFAGIVERIGLRSTRIRTPDKTMVTVPNKQMVDSILDNWSMRTQVRNEIRIELSPQASSEKIQFAINEIKKILHSRSEVAFNATVFLTEVTKNAALLVAEYFTNFGLPVNDQNKLKEEINLEIKKMQEENGIRSSVANSFTFVNPDPVSPQRT